jgi:tetratricopeptide (TPR) repeat protein
MLILVANFDRPEMANYHTTEQIVQMLNSSLEEDRNSIEIRPLEQFIDRAEEAIRVGDSAKATIIIWGWIDKTGEKSLLNANFQVLNKPKDLPPLQEGSDHLQKFDLEYLDSLQLQEELSNQMAYLSLFTIGMAHYAHEDWVGAIKRFDKALNIGQFQQLNPGLNKGYIYYYRGRAYTAKGAYDNAFDDYTSAVTANPQLAEAYNGLGVVSNLRQDCDQSEAYFKRALDLNPQYAEAYYNRGSIYYDQGTYDKAIDDFDQAIKYRSDYIEAINKRASAYSSRGETQQAKNQYQTLINTYDEQIASGVEDLAESFHKRGNAYQDKGDYENAIRDYKLAIQQRPDFWQAYNDLGHAYYKSHDYENALASYQKVIELQPNYAGGYYDRGKVKRSQNDYDGALADFNLANAHDEKFKTSYYARAEIYKSRKQYDLAVAEYKKVLSFMKPCDAKWNVYNGLGDIYYEAGDYDLSLE